MSAARAARPLALGPDELGECARWNAANGELWRIDILAGLVHRTRDPLAVQPVTRSLRFDGEVGFAVPRAGGGVVVGVERELWLIDEDGARRRLLELDEPASNRFNDATCDSRGRLWTGTFARDRRPGAANLYRIDPDGTVERVLSGLTISNGLGWLDDGDTLHFVDSPTQRVDRFDVDQEAGRLSGRRRLVAVELDAGAPDGLCVDAEGCTWVALFGGGAVRRYSSDGSLIDEVALPVAHVTSPCIGGETGTELFATTTRHRLDAAARRATPLAGRVFHAEAGVTAPPPLPFGG